MRSIAKISRDYLYLNNFIKIDIKNLYMRASQARFFYYKNSSKHEQNRKNLIMEVIMYSLETIIAINEQDYQQWLAKQKEKCESCDYKTDCQKRQELLFQDHLVHSNDEES